MKKTQYVGKGIVIGLLVLLLEASVFLPATARFLPDPDLSFVELTNTNAPGMNTCPAGDGFIYHYLKVTVKTSTGEPMINLNANSFQFIITAVSGTVYHGTLSCTFTAVDAVTNANGEIRFEIQADTSIVGNINIVVKVLGIQINDMDTLSCKSVDYDVNGMVSLGDFTVFGADYTTTAWRSDFNWDGQVSLADFTVFGQHYTHT